MVSEGKSRACGIGIRILIPVKVNFDSTVCVLTPFLTYAEGVSACLGVTALSPAWPH